MRAIGFRAEKDVVHWAVVEGTIESPKLIADNKFSAPRPTTKLIPSRGTETNRAR